MMSNSGGQPTCCQQLLENERHVMLDALRVLIKCADNILQNPTEQKFRRLPVGNTKVQQCLLPAYGAIECLFEMGFVESDDHFLLPETASLVNLRIVRDALVALCQDDGKASTSAGGIQDSMQGGNTVAPEEQALMVFWLRKETEFYGVLKRGLAHVANFVKPELLEKARCSMPLEQLLKKAKECCVQLCQSDQYLPDQLLIQLLRWFKELFFKWMDTPLCCVCGASTKLIGQVTPLPEESAHLAGTVENYRCDAGCVQFTRFPRYNDPGRLLETRVGRCGEWANCFTLLCLAAGLEARHVVDWGDHVWTEVYSTGQGRWLHADPCENVCDEPLLYESGWGKKMSYVIAYSTDDIQDVTWRYTAHPADVLTRRTACREPWLARTLVELRNNIQEERLRNSASRRAVLAKRTALELVELMTEKSEVSSLPGRTTGSEDWRRARGELGTTPLTKSCAIVPSELEVDAGILELRYSSVKDEYVRPSDNNSTISGWQNLVYEAVSVFRKEECDWKMVYLARMEGREVGKVVWEFSLGSRNACIDRVEIEVHSSCFESGRVHWTLTDSGDRSVAVSPRSRQSFDVFNGSSKLRLVAELSGGNGRTAWQHAQLFRQSLTDSRDQPLVVVLHLRRTCSS